MELTGIHLIGRLVATDLGMRLDVRWPNGDRVGEPRLTRLPAPLEAKAEKRALLAIVRRLDTAVARGENPADLLDEVALVRLNRAGAVLLPRSVRSAPARPNAGRRSDKRGVTRAQTMNRADKRP